MIQTFRSSVLFAVFVCFAINESANADRLYFQDGTTLRCQFVEEVVEGDKRYIRVQIGNASVLIQAEAVKRIEETPETGAESEEVRRKLEALLQAGTAVQNQENETNVETSSETDSDRVTPLVAKTIKGWGYLYENVAAYNRGQRTALREGETVPPGQLLVSSPNSRLTLAIGDVGRIGIEGQSRIRFDSIRVNRTQTYEIDVHLSEGSFWTQVGGVGENWERVKFIINTAQVIVQVGTFYVVNQPRHGAVDIAYLAGNSDVKFWRSTDVPVTASIGELVKVSPGSIDLEVQPIENPNSLLDTIDSWEAWQPEPLAVELDVVLPPLKTYDPLPAIPAMYPFRIEIDPSIAFPPETRSLGELFSFYYEALDRFEFDTGTYPTSEQGLEALIEPLGIAGWKGPYLPRSTPLRDYWGNPFEYERYELKNETMPSIYSIGPNQQDDQGLEDDIR